MVYNRYTTTCPSVREIIHSLVVYLLVQADNRGIAINLFYVLLMASCLLKYRLVIFFSKREKRLKCFRLVYITNKINGK